MIEIILRQSVKDLGGKNKIVKVKDGYANYLIAQKTAVLGTKASKKNLAEALKQQEGRDQKIRTELEKLSQQLDSIKLVLLEKVDESGHLFASITPLKIAEAYKANHIRIDHKKISILNSPIKEPGMHQATITLHKDLKKTVQFQVRKD